MFNRYLNLLTTLAIGISAACGLFLAVGSNLFGSNPSAAQPLWLTLLLFSLTILFGFASIFTTVRANKYRPSYPLIILLSILFIINLVNVLIYKSPTTYEYYLTSGEPISISFSIHHATARFVYILRFFAVLYIAYLLLDVFPKIHKTNHLFKVVCFGLLIFGGIAIIYSFFSESIKYQYLLTFDNFFIRLPTLAIYSFFKSKNSFGTVMLLASISSLLLFKEKKNPRWIIPLFIFNFWLLLSQCKMCIAAGFLIEIAYFVGLLILTFKDHKKRNLIIIVSVFAGLILVTSILLFIPASREFIKKIFANLFVEKGGKNTFDTRQIMWSYSLNIISKANYISGVGFGLFDDILYCFNFDSSDTLMYQMTTAHNVFLQMLANGGVILLLVWISLLAYLIYVSIKLFKQHKEDVLIALILMGSMILYGIFESSCMIFVSSGEFACLSYLIINPVMQLKHKELEPSDNKILNLI